MIISLIVAADLDGAIGRDGDLPWHLPADLRHFKQLTVGKPVVMGRRTFASLPAPLPRRLNVVLTRDPAFRAPGASVASSAEEALALCGDAPEVMICGGAGVYAAFLPRADRVYLTRVRGHVGGDTFLPDLGAGWVETARREHPADERHAYAMTFVTLERAVA